MRKSSSFAALIFIIIFGIGLVIAFTTYRVTANTESVFIGAFAFVVALFVSLAIKVADQWEKVVILRLGKFRSLKGRGLFFIILLLLKVLSASARKAYMPYVLFVMLSDVKSFGSSTEFK